MVTNICKQLKSLMSPLRGVILAGVIMIVGLVPLQSFGAGFMSDFAGPLMSEGGWGDEKAYTIEGVSYELNHTLVDNIKALLYPEDDGGALWNIIRNIAIAILIVLFIWAGAYLMLYGSNPEELKKGLLNLLYIVVGGGLLFLALWILKDGIDFSGFTGLTGSDDSVLKQAEDNIFFFVLGTLKAIAFFAAIVFIIYYGYSIITAFDAEEKQKNARQGLLNVILALVFIKIIDFIYFITLQEDFRSEAVKFIVELSKGLGYVLGIVLVVAMIYAGYMMVTANGDKDQVNKAGSMVKNIFIAVIVLMLFLLIIYQIFNDVVG